MNKDVLSFIRGDDAFKLIVLAAIGYKQSEEFSDSENSINDLRMSFEKVILPLLLPHTQALIQGLWDEIEGYNQHQKAENKCPPCLIHLSIIGMKLMDFATQANSQETDFLFGSKKEYFFYESMKAAFFEDILPSIEESERTEILQFLNKK